MSSKESFYGKDDTHWVRDTESSSGQKDSYVGKNDGSGDHCHAWKTSDGRSGVEHRGHCKVCDDEKNGDSGTGPQK